MTIEQEWEKYKDHKHLIGTLPRSAYVRIMLYGLALQEQMERTLAELGSAPMHRRGGNCARIAQGERKAKAGGRTSSGLEVAPLEAISAKKAS